MSTGSRPSTDEYFVRMAELVAERATCFRRSVGCVLVDAHNHVLATGYNGVAKGLPHCMGEHTCPGAHMPSGQGLHLCEAIHAEVNALVQCSDVTRIFTVYCTASPCVQCMRLILGTGARRIVFRQEYPHAESKRLALSAGIEWHCQDRL